MQANIVVFWRDIGGRFEVPHRMAVVALRFVDETAFEIVVGALRTEIDRLVIVVHRAVVIAFGAVHGAAGLVSCRFLRRHADDGGKIRDGGVVIVLVGIDFAARAIAVDQEGLAGNQRRDVGDGKVDLLVSHIGRGAELIGLEIGRVVLQGVCEIGNREVPLLFVLVRDAAIHIGGRAVSAERDRTPPAPS